MINKITKTNIVELFLSDYGKKYYLREIASLLKKPHQTIKPHLEGLVKEKILLKEKRKNLVEYFLNLKERKICDALTIAEKEKLMKRLEEDVHLKVLYEKLFPFFTDNTFIVFGSAAEKIKEGSDIDLLIIGKKNIDNALKDFEEIYSRKLHKVQVANLEELDLTLVKEIYKKHLIFNNTEQIIRFFWRLHEENKLV